MITAGKIIKGLGNVIGNVTEQSFKVTGKLIEAAANKAGKENLAKTSKDLTEVLGLVVGEGTKATANLAGTLVDKAVDGGIKTAKIVGSMAVKTETRIYGDSENFYDNENFIDAEYKEIK